MLTNQEKLAEAATLASALTWPVEVADVRLGKTATAYQVGTFELTGPALAWAVLQPTTDQPKTYGCHHNMPTCSLCEDMVRRWLVKELGHAVKLPAELQKVAP